MDAFRRYIEQDFRRRLQATLEHEEYWRKEKVAPLAACQRKEAKILVKGVAAVRANDPKRFAQLGKEWNRLLKDEDKLYAARRRPARDSRIA
jgi:hypothetical protein